MVVVELYSKCLKYRYKNYLFSKATIFIAITSAINVVLPFLFSYSSRGFWLKHDTFYEQPEVRLRGEYLFVAYTNKMSYRIICNNFAYYDSDGFEDDCTEIKVREIDNNLDGKIDEFRFSLTLNNLPNNTNINYFDLLLTLDYKLHTTCPLHMQSMLLLQETITNFISRLSISSIVELSQTSPIYCHPKMKNTHFNKSIIAKKDFDSHKFKNIVEEYTKRNLTTYLSSTYKTFGLDERGFQLNLKVKYPQHRIYYMPGFWQIMKWAWMQYISVYIIMWWCLAKIKNYVFDNRLVLFHEENPIKMKQD